MGAASALGGASAVLAAEICAPLLLLCWLCCWPDDASESGVRRRSHDLFGRRFGSSAVSLHLPSTSGSAKQPLSAYRSNEEIRGRRKSHLEIGDNETRYHSAPSVIDEVIHRRDWDRSTKELYIPLRPDGETVSPTKSDSSDNSQRTYEQVVSKMCKKHYTNIKSSKKKETDHDIKDHDATEVSSFYIGDNEAVLTVPETSSIVNNDGSINEPIEVLKDDSRFKPKETKQCLNESIKSKDRKKQTLVPVEEFKVSRFEDVNVEVDRSGAIHHSVESRSSLYNHVEPIPAPSVEAVGYDSEVTYLEETPVWTQNPNPSTWTENFIRARHASAGDVLAPPMRPQSSALSESDLDWDLEACDELPPSYNEVHLLPDRKETAI
ncbi:unnamed protein product [Leptosia nina]|uniref:Uncharacterized protein n=1 Tax=Leptosia nina TaxID=320188 RepID=A0AAV1JFW2_9NEOP